MFNELVANTIYIVHFLVLLFVVIAPFTSNQKVLTIEMALLITIMFHWITNNQVCCLTEFEKISGHGVLLNTSFNVNGQPILSTVGEAFTVLNSTQMDGIVIENTLILKK